MSSNVGNRSLPITTSSSACARLCTCGNRTRARKREDIDDTLLNVSVSKKRVEVYRNTYSVYTG
jgi:hypothetical protein